MNTKPLFKGNKSILPPTILALGFIGAGLASYFLIEKSLSLLYYQIAGLTLGIIFGIFSLSCLIAVFLIDNLKLFDDKIVVGSTLGFVKRTIFLKDITKWTQIKKETKYTQWKDVIIFYGDKKYTISSAGYKNYKEIKLHIVNGKKNDKSEAEKWLNRIAFRDSILFILAGLLALCGAFSLYTYQFGGLDENVITIGAIVDKSSKGKRSVEVFLKQYPEFKFTISGVAYSEMYKADYWESVAEGDSLYLTIDESVARKKIFRTLPLEYLDKHYGWDRISVYALRDKRNNYLTQNDYSKSKRKEVNILLAVALLLGAGLLGYGLYGLRKLKLTATND